MAVNRDKGRTNNFINMKASEIMQLEGLQNKLQYLEKNLSPLSDSDIDRSRRFYLGDHRIKYDPNLMDTPDREPIIDPEFPDHVSYHTYWIRRTKLCLPYAQQIILTRAAFIMGNGLNLVFESDNDEDISSYDKFTKDWENSNIITMLRESARLTGIETRCAVQFFVSDSGIIKGKVLSHENGYRVYRHKDENEKMDAVVVEYNRDVFKNGEVVNGVSTVEIYLQNEWYRYSNGELDEGFPMKNPKGTTKILFAFFEQEYPEYWFVMNIIDKQDYARSQHSDVNTRIGNPALVVNGKLATKPKISDAVKIYEIQSTGNSLDGTSSSSSADMKYLEVKGAPESVELELKNNERDIYRFSWPDLYMLIEKAISGNLSSKSIKLMFTHVSAKISEERENWDEMVRRCISIMKDISAAINGDDHIRDLDIKFKYNSILPSSTDDLVNMLSSAVGANITTHERAASQLDFNDPKTVKDIGESEKKGDFAGKQAIVKPKNNNAPNETGVNG